MVLAFEFDFAIALLAFWLVQANAFKYMLQYVVFFFAGALLPLDLFPKAIEAIANVLPFRYLAFFPSQIFLEKEAHPVAGLIGALAWSVGLYLFLRFVLNRGSNDMKRSATEVKTQPSKQGLIRSLRRYLFSIGRFSSTT